MDLRVAMRQKHRGSRAADRMGDIDAIEALFSKLKTGKEVRLPFTSEVDRSLRNRLAACYCIGHAAEIFGAQVAHRSASSIAAAIAASPRCFNIIAPAQIRSMGLAIP